MSNGATLSESPGGGGGVERADVPGEQPDRGRDEEGEGSRFPTGGAGSMEPGRPTDRTADTAQVRVIFERYARAWLSELGIRVSLAGAFGAGCVYTLRQLARTIDPASLAECSIETHAAALVASTDRRMGEAGGERGSRLFRRRAADHDRDFFRGGAPQDMIDADKLRAYIEGAIHGLSDWHQVAMLKNNIGR